MKKVTFLILVSIFLLAACSTPATSPPEPEDPSISTRQGNVDQDQPAQPESSTAPLEESPMSDSFIFKDDFEGSIEPGWKWVRENNSKWSLSTNPGWLEITAGSGSAHAGNSDNLLLRQIPTGNFELEIKLKFKPTADFQIAGLIIYESAEKFIQYGRAFANCEDSICANDGLYMDMIIDGSFTGMNFAMPIPDPESDTMYLRLQREGNNYLSFFSEDGSKWDVLGGHTSEMDPQFVGLVAGQSTTGSQPAQFEYFIINSLP